jgi:hypothetical protein
MVVGVTLLVITVLIAAIWIIIEIKRLKHKLFAIVLIGLILFSYLSFNAIFKEEKVDFTSLPGIIDASKIYFSWLGSIFVNLKSITNYAVQQNWARTNQSIKES